MHMYVYIYANATIFVTYFTMEKCDDLSLRRNCMRIAICVGASGLHAVLLSDVYEDVFSCTDASSTQSDLKRVKDPSRFCFLSVG